MNITTTCFVWGFIAVAASRAWCAATEQDKRPPNVIIIFTDDQGYGDLSCYGHPTIHTPHIDRLAVEGAKLTQFYVASPVCSPSRAALLTGCYPKRVGMHKHVIFPPYDYGLHTDEVTLADMLRDAGYATGCFGKWHLGHRAGLLPTDQGFDVFFGVPYSNDMAQFHRNADNTYKHSLPLLRNDEIVEWEPDQHLLTRRYTEEAIDFIERHHDQPFFVYLPHSMPHIPIYASEEFAGRSPRGLYGDVIEEIDWSVGQLLDCIDTYGLSDDTIILFTSDNGPWLSFNRNGGSAGLLRGGKGTNWEGGQRVPCVIRWPSRIPAGSVVRSVVTAMDLLPTLATWTAAEIDANRQIDGRDVSGLLAGNVPDDLSHTFLYYTSQGELAGIRRGPWKMLLENNELYNVEVDVSEAWNVADRNPDLVSELRTLALEADRRIAEDARPTLRVEEPLWDPAHRVRPAGD